jgi:hypothetical protein
MTKAESKQLSWRLSRMEANNIEKPYEALEQYFSSFSLSDCRRHLWELYEQCVISYAREGSDHEEAADILFFYTHTEMLVEAAWLIKNKRQRNKDKKKDDK